MLSICPTRIQVPQGQGRADFKSNIYLSLSSFFFFSLSPSPPFHSTHAHSNVAINSGRKVYIESYANFYLTCFCNVRIIYFKNFPKSLYSPICSKACVVLHIIIIKNLIDVLIFYRDAIKMTNKKIFKIAFLWLFH